MLKIFLNSLKLRIYLWEDCNLIHTKHALNNKESILDRNSRWKVYVSYMKLFLTLETIFCKFGVKSCRDVSRIPATFKMERFVIIVNGWKPLTIVTKSFILDVATVLDLPLMLCNIS